MTVFWYFVGGLVSILLLAGLVLAVFFLCGSVGMDGLFAASEPRGELTCWHCGQPTRAGLKHCGHCGKELQ